MGSKKCAGVRDLIEQTRGGVLALVALFLPIAVLCVGMVVDLGTVFFVRKAVQAACDLGALAAVQELDWDLLALGTVSLRVGEAEAVAEEITGDNLEGIEALVRDVQVSATALNPPAEGEPTVAVTVTYSVRTPFLRTLPGLGEGFHDRRVSEASVVKRTEW
ncbi:MAG: pilus assembly protein TadG-related protein [Bacillota bacterium]